MTLGAGTKLGPYEILSPLGAGGMGEVYRAKDTRLGREIAIKVLPENLASDRERLARFEQEARAASALSHPNILTVYDIGREGGQSFIAMELVEGKSLRELLESGPLPLRKGLDLATQIADGLAKAHEAGIVHRDLKPENVMVSKDGFAKILDFGLAKLSASLSDGASNLPTAAPGTAPGIVMGTVGYMSPEQAAGRPADYRSDQFSFGAVGYEMAAGRKPFARKTSAETLTAILREEPEPLGAINPKVPAPARWIIERCLAKDPEDRYTSTRDLARDLRSVKDHLSEASVSGITPAAEPERRRRRALLFGGGAAGALIALALAFLAGRASSRTVQPKFQRLTFQRGSVLAARFAPDGQTVVYSAAWEGHAARIFSLRPGTPETTPLSLPDANLLAVSPSGELAIDLRPLGVGGGFGLTGTLARVPLAGGAPKEILNDVSYADWSPGGADLAVIHHAAGKDRLEYPIGRVLDATAGWFQDPRFSPDGRRIAYLDHPSSGDPGSVAAVDLSGHKTTLASGWATLQGLAWSRDGREIWFTAAKEGIERELYAVSLSGKLRLVRTLQGTPALLDVSPKGGALISEDDYRSGTLLFQQGQSAPADLSWFDWQSTRALSPDGKTVLFDETGEGGGPGGSVFVRSTDGSPAVRLGSGIGLALSPDSQWALTRSQAEPAFTSLVPIGPGQPVKFPPDGLSGFSASFLPDGESFVFEGNAPGHATRLYLEGVKGGPPRPISAEGLTPSNIFVSPDGSRVAAIGGDRKIRLYPISGGAPVDLPSARVRESPAGFTTDGRGLYVSRPGIPCELDLLDLATGQRTKVRGLAGADAGGVLSFGPVRVTPDGRAMTLGYSRVLSTLYRVEGLK